MARDLGSSEDNRPVRLSDVGKSSQEENPSLWKDGETISLQQWRRSSFGRALLEDDPAEDIPSQDTGQDGAETSGRRKASTPLSEQSVLSKWEGMCSKREYSSGQVRLKVLKDLQGDEAATERVLSSLLGNKYIDDERFSRSFARDKSSLDGWGREKIKVELRRKGLPSDTIARALSEIDPEKSSERMESVLRGKWKSVCDDPRSKYKLLEFGLRRGYPYDDLRPVVDAIYKEYRDAHPSDGPTCEEWEG